MNRCLHSFTLLLGVSLLAAAGCSRKLEAEKPGMKHKPGDVVVRVDGHSLTWEDADRRAQSYLKDDVSTKGLLIPKEREEDALNFYRRKAVVLFVNKTVLSGEARRRGITVTDADRQAALKTIEPLLKAQGLSSLDAFFKKSPLGEKETRREYEDGLHIDKLIGLEVTNKIVVTDADRDAISADIVAKRLEAKRKIDALRAQLVKGGDFATLARNNSEDGSKQAGGDLGEFSRGRMEKAFEDAAFSQRINETGPVVETRYGYHLLKVTAHTAAKAATATTPATPETVRVSHILIRTPPPVTGKDIDNLVRRKKYEVGLRNLLESLRSQARIETIYKDLVLKPNQPAEKK